MAKLTLPSCVRPTPAPAEPALPYEEALLRLDAVLAALRAGGSSSAATREEALEAALKAADEMVAAHRAARASRR